MFQNIFKELFYYDKINTLLYLLASLFQKIISFYFIVLLVELLNDINNITIHKLIITVSLPLIAYLINLYSLYIEYKFSKYYCSKYSFLLIKSVNNLNLTDLERLASRDMNILLDNIQNSFSLISTIIFFGFVSCYFALYFPNLLIYYSVSCTFLGIIAYKISKLGDNNFSHIINIMGKRIDLSLQWLRKGYLLKQFIGHTFTKVDSNINDINNVLSQERKLRNIDTLIQSINRYIITFGRLLIYILLIIGSVTINSNEIILLLWLSLPIINAIFNLPSYYISYKNVIRIIKNLNDHFENSYIKISINIDSKANNIIYNNDFAIYPAKFIELIPFYNNIDKNELNYICQKFRLIPELAPNLDELLNLEIDLNANRLSNGQKFRLQIIRQFIMAKFLNIKFIIEHNFNSLDKQIAKDIKSFLLDNNVELTKDALKTFDESKNNSKHTQQQYNVNNNTKFKKIDKKNHTLNTKFKTLYSFLFSVLVILPTAFLLSYSTSISIENISLSWLICYFIISLFFGISGAILIESRIRRAISNKFTKKMANLFTTDKDKVQVASRDLTTIFEKISWYTLDIAWIISLFIINFISLIFIFNIFGIILFIIFVILLIILYFFSIGIVTKTRISTIKGFDLLIQAVQVIYAVESIKKNLNFAHEFYNSYKIKIVQNNIKYFFSTRIKSLISKSIVSSTALLISDIFMILLLIIYYLYNHQNNNLHSLMVISLTSLLIIRNDLVNIFFAIIGFESQSISIKNVDNFCSHSANLLINQNNKHLNIPSFFYLDNRTYYKSLEINLNDLYLLSGNSGVGKSCYLKAIANISKSEFDDISITTNVKTYYITNEVIKELEILIDDNSLNKLLENIAKHTSINKNHALIILDEILVSNTDTYISNLKKLIAKFKNITIIIVNHNIKNINVIEMDKLII